MSGGAWDYQQEYLRRQAAWLRSDLAPILEAVAQTEHIVDWVVSGDTLRAEGERELFDLWFATLDFLFSAHE